MITSLVIRPKHCVISGITPGDYKLFSWEKVEQGEWLDPDFRKPMEDQGKSIHVEKVGHQTSEVKIMPARKRQQN